MKSLVYALLILFTGLHGSGCSGPDLGDDSGALGEIVTLQGTIANWPKGTDATVLATVVTATGLTQPLTMGPIAKSGAFSIELPQSVALDPYLLQYGQAPTASACTRLPFVDPPEFKSSTLVLTAMKPTLPVLSLVLTSNTDEYFGSFSHREAKFLYVDRDVTITGELRCHSASTEFVVGYDYRLRKGWNTLILDNGDPTGGPTEFRLVSITYTKAAPADLKWMKSE